MTEWLTWMRPQLMDTWENYQHMRDLMWPEYQRAGLPEALLFGILAKESNGRVHAISRAGATGPLQFMPATGRRFGLHWVDGFDQRFDPQLSARANVAYLDEQFQAFNHDLGLALAAYNGGEGRVGRLYARSGGAGFWDPRVYGELPQETRDYVPFVLAAAWLFLHPEDYGLRFPRVEAGEPVQLELTRAMTLNELAICLGDTSSREGWFRALRNLNPRWQVGDVLEPGTSLRVPPMVRRIYRRQCAEGTPLATTAHQLVTASRLAAAAAPAGSALAPGGTSSGGAARTYTVRSGDTLQGIARAQRCSVRAIASANGLRAPRYLLRVGQVLRIEGC
jgi:membrane-bound lytic murein transglycosylase D